MVIAVAALAVVGLAFVGGSARAAVAAPDSSQSHSVRLGASGLTVSAAITPPSGNFTLTVDAGASFDKTVMQQILDEAQAENARLSDTIKRGVEEFPLGVTGDDTSGWQNFDGTLSITPDGTGVSMTIPAGEVQTAANWWQTIIATGLGALVGYTIRALCLGTGPGAVVCTPVGGFVGGLVQGLITQAFDGSFASGTAWAATLAKALVGAVGGYAWEKWVKDWATNTLPGIITNIGNWITLQAKTTWAFLGSFITSGLESAGGVLNAIGAALPQAVRNLGSQLLASSLSCDIYDWGGTPCAAAYSMDRALYSYYDGPLYQVQRASDEATADIGPLSAGGDVNASQQDSFCSGTTCTITKIYDQSPEWDDLTIEGAGGAAGADHGASATALPITVGGNKAYGLDVTGQIGYRDDSTQGIAVNGEPEGMYMVASGTNVNSGCCFDFGNAETNNHDTGASHMDAVNLTTFCGSYEQPCSGSGPWVEADMENGQYLGGDGSNPADTSNSSDFVTAVLKNDGQTTFELEGGNAQSGGLAKYWDGNLPSGYSPMHQEGAIVLGTGGDNSNSDVGSFFEGVMTQGFPSDADDSAVQAGIVAAGYAGNSGTAPGGGGGGGGSGSNTDVMPSAAGPAVVHTAGATGRAASGFSSVYTVDAGSGDLQETYLPYVGDAWTTQNLSKNYGTPPVMPGIEPVSVVHCGYTSVFTVDTNGDLQETYLSNIGNVWATHDLTTLYGTPKTDVIPTALVHDAGATGQAAACGFTSVYTVDSSNGDLQETYLPYIGDAWTTQDLSKNYGTPAVRGGTSPVSLVHCGYTSVWTVDANGDLQETYLSNIGNVWATHDLTQMSGTPKTDVTPTALVHDAGATGQAAACGFTSVYTVDSSNDDLQETYLPYIGDAWTTQNLSVNYGTPPVLPAAPPVALYHTGYTSVFTVDKSNDDVQETYLSNIGNVWATHDLTGLYGTPATDWPPVVLLHPAPSGSLTWTSIYTRDNSNDDLQESYLPAIGDPWTTQDLSANYGTPALAAP